jgi:hypothetical protein
MDLRCGFGRLGLLALALAGLAGLAGCASTYIDSDGTRHVIGLVHLTLPPSAPEPKVADWMRVRTVGLAVSRTDLGATFTLGYADDTLAAIRNNSCVQLDRLPSPLLAARSPP